MKTLILLLILLLIFTGFCFAQTLQDTLDYNKKHIVSIQLSMIPVTEPALYDEYEIGNIISLPFGTTNLFSNDWMPALGDTIFITMPNDTALDIWDGFWPDFWEDFLIQTEGMDPGFYQGKLRLIGDGTFLERNVSRYDGGFFFQLTAPEWIPAEPVRVRIGP